MKKLSSLDTLSDPALFAQKESHLHGAMSSYEEQRLENIRQKQALLKELDLSSRAAADSRSDGNGRTRQEKHPARRRKEEPLSRPIRTSARLASTIAKPEYAEHDGDKSVARSRARKARSFKFPNSSSSSSPKPQPQPPPSLNILQLKQKWTSWTPSAQPPTRHQYGHFHFPSHPHFTPNVSPAEMLRYGSFGGSYFRPYYSFTLSTTIRDDWRELPPSWLEGLDIERYLTSSTYRPDVNKFGVKCGQSIEEWERQGWIKQEFDVRGWFQWYVRFWIGRRCVDDERQIGRWARCVGGNGRWRKALLKKYMQLGVRNVSDEGFEEEDIDVSPVMHQTCFHWGLAITQDMLDEFWQTGK